MSSGLDLPPQAQAQRQLNADLMGLRISLTKDIHQLLLAKSSGSEDDPWKDRPEDFEQKLAEQAVKHAEAVMLALGFKYRKGATKEA